MYKVNRLYYIWLPKNEKNHQKGVVNERWNAGNA